MSQMQMKNRNWVLHTEEQQSSIKYACTSILILGRKIVNNSEVNKGNVNIDIDPARLWSLLQECIPNLCSPIKPWL